MVDAHDFIAGVGRKDFCWDPFMVGGSGEWIGADQIATILAQLRLAIHGCNALCIEMEKSELREIRVTGGRSIGAVKAGRNA